MGRTMNKNLRRGLMVLLALLLMGSAGLAVWWFKQPATAENQVPVYACQQQGQVDYQVFLTPNDLLPEKVTGPDQTYITSLTQHIETTLNYRFSGEAPADLSGQYQVDAAVTGYVLQERSGSQEGEREKIKIWTKSSVLLPPTPFSIHDSQLELQQMIPIDIRSYMSFADQVAQELSFSADLVELAVTYSVQTAVSTPQGTLEEPLTLVMVIPLGGSTFTVQGTLTDTKDNSIFNGITESVFKVKAARIGFTAATVILALLLLLTIVFTKAKEQDPVEKKLRQIIRKHGDRIVAGVVSIPAVSGENTIKVHSFDDLVKVADEVAQPILYDNSQVSDHLFYVVNEPLIYRYSLKTDAKQGSGNHEMKAETRKN